MLPELIGYLGGAAGSILQAIGFAHIQQKIVSFLYKPTFDEIKQKKVFPMVAHIVERSNDMLSTVANTNDVMRLIDFCNQPSDSNPDMVGKRIIVPLKTEAVAAKTLSYSTAKYIADFAFAIVTRRIFGRHKKIRDVAMRTVLDGALSKVEPEYGPAYVNDMPVDEQSVDDFVRLTTHTGLFKKEIYPLLSRVGNEDKILDTITEVANSHEGVDQTSKQHRFEEMESRLTPEEMVRLVIGGTELQNKYQYVKGLRYIYLHPGSRLFEIAQGTEIPRPTVYWTIIKHLTKTRLIEKSLVKKRPRYKVSAEFDSIKNNIMQKTIQG